jgi:hypothetical protein
MDHVFVSGSLIKQLEACDVGSADRVFAAELWVIRPAHYS